MQSTDSPAHLKRNALLFVVLCSSLFLGTAVAISNVAGIPIEYLTKDITSLPPEANTNIVYMGMISQVGLLFWFAAAAVALFSAICGARIHRVFEYKWFFYSAGLLSLILGFDDLFQGHEMVYPHDLGIPEKVVYAIYAFLTALFLATFRKKIMATDYGLLILAFFLFAISVLQDLFAINISSIDPFLIEDGAKFSGIVSWFTYFFISALNTLGVNPDYSPKNLVVRQGGIKIYE